MNRELDVRLARLEPVGVDSKMNQAVTDWHYWNERYTDNDGLYIFNIFSHASHDLLLSAYLPDIPGTAVDGSTGGRGNASVRSDPHG